MLIAYKLLNTNSVSKSLFIGTQATLASFTPGDFKLPPPAWDSFISKLEQRNWIESKNTGLKCVAPMDISIYLIHA